MKKLELKEDLKKALKRREAYSSANGEIDRLVESIEKLKKSLKKLDNERMKVNNDIDDLEKRIAIELGSEFNVGDKVKVVARYKKWGAPIDTTDENDFWRVEYTGFYYGFAPRYLGFGDVGLRLKKMKKDGTESKLEYNEYPLTDYKTIVSIEKIK